MLRGPRSQGAIVNSLSPVGGVPAEPGRWSDNSFLCKPPRRYAPPLHRGEQKKHRHLPVFFNRWFINLLV